MPGEKIPWDKKDIFHDNPAEFPLEDYFPADEISETEVEIVVIENNSKGQP